MFHHQLQQYLTAQERHVPQLAAYCDVSEQAAYRWVSGKAEPRPKMKARIAEFFGISQQKLEYGPVLSLDAIGPDTAPLNSDPDSAVQAAQLIVAAELSICQPKSQEYRQGMLDFVIYKLSGQDSPLRFLEGTCQFEAYQAGYDHSEDLLYKLAINSG